MRFLSSVAHTIIGLVIGLALLAAPWLFMFSDVGGAAVAVPIWVGLFLLVSELTTTSQISLVKLVPMSAHVFIDVLAGIFLALSPFFFAFTDEGVNAWLPHMIVGVLIIGYALVTRTSEVTHHHHTVAHQ